MGRAVMNVVVLLVALALIASCQGSDPFGATTRERVRSDAAVAITKIEAQAAVEQAALHATASQANAQAWAQTLLLVAIVLVGGSLAAIVLYFHGRAFLLRVERNHFPTLPEDDYSHELLVRYAERRNLVVRQTGRGFVLFNPTTGKQVRALPKVRD